MVTPAGATGDSGVSAFAITVTAATSHGRHTLKNANSFAVFDAGGQIQAAGPAAEGFFFEDTRYLSRLALALNGAPALLLSSTVTEGNRTLFVDMANPGPPEAQARGLPPASIHLCAEISLGTDALFAEIAVRNYASERAELELAIELDADFVDLFEVRGTPRRHRGERLPAEQRREGPVFAYRGLDGVTRRSVVTFEPQPETLQTNRATWRFSLEPGVRSPIRLSVYCERDGHQSRRLGRAASLAADKTCLARRRAGVAQIATSNPIFDEWLRCSRGDLDMLTTETPHGFYPYAGVPWFSTAFGRDGLITAFACLWLDPELGAGTLRFLAANQATEVDDRIDAEPGKILHETRLGEMAALGEVPFGRYYGSINSTPLFVMLAAAYYERTADQALIVDLWPHIDAALAWISDYGDLDGDGFVEYRRKSPNGLDNHGWKDSGDAIFHADGRLAEPPIALAEVQGYVYAALSGAAVLARVVGRAPRAAELEAAAHRLKERFEAAFWLDDLGTYALALDGAKRPCRVISSNAGQTLWAGIARPDRAANVAQTLTQPASFSGWGIRTIADGQVRYNPMSYHDGSVWPHDNALIALGFARYGLKEETLRVLDGLFAAVQGFELKRMPELFCGFERRGTMGPTGYPLACAPQAWSAATAFALVAAVLGISFVPREHQVRFLHPVLPPWLREVHLTNLRLGEASIDLRLGRDGHAVAIDVVRSTGPVEIVMTY